MSNVHPHSFPFKFPLYSFTLNLKGIFSDSSNLFLWHESGNINKLEFRSSWLTRSLYSQNMQRGPPLGEYANEVLNMCINTTEHMGNTLAHYYPHPKCFHFSQYFPEWLCVSHTSYMRVLGLYRSTHACFVHNSALTGSVALPSVGKNYHCESHWNHWIYF